MPMSRTLAAAVIVLLGSGVAEGQIAYRRGSSPAEVAAVTYDALLSGIVLTREKRNSSESVIKKYYADLAALDRTQPDVMARVIDLRTRLRENLLTLIAQSADRVTFLENFKRAFPSTPNPKPGAS
jgi:hypothetical protein